MAGEKRNAAPCPACEVCVGLCFSCRTKALAAQSKPAHRPDREGFNHPIFKLPADEQARVRNAVQACVELVRAIPEEDRLDFADLDDPFIPVDLDRLREAFRLAKLALGVDHG